MYKLAPNHCRVWAVETDSPRSYNLLYLKKSTNKYNNYCIGSREVQIQLRLALLLEKNLFKSSKQNCAITMDMLLFNLCTVKVFRMWKRKAELMLNLPRSSKYVVFGASSEMLQHASHSCVTVSARYAIELTKARPAELAELSMTAASKHLKGCLGPASVTFFRLSHF